MVHIYVLNDAVLVTSWKKNPVTGKAKMVVEYFWDLADLGIIDVKDSGGKWNENERHHCKLTGFVRAKI
jgi:hypothetical protein